MNKIIIFVQVTIRKKSYKKQLENASREARNALKLSLEVCPRHKTIKVTFIQNY